MVCFKRCCCCVNLRVGGIMMGVMTLALSIFSIVPMAIFLAHRVFMARVITHLVDEYSTGDGGGDGGKPADVDSVAFWGTVNEAFNSETGEHLPAEDSDDVVWLAYAMLVFFIISLVLLALYAVCSILLIFGATKGRRWMLLPWIVASFAFILAYFAGMCLSLWLIGLQVLAIVFFFIALIEIVIAVYLWVCVLSLYQVLGSGDWANRDDWEMKPRFTTKYNGVPTSEND